MRKLWFLAPVLVVLLLLGSIGIAVAQQRDPPLVDFEQRFPSPRVVGPPPPMADVWTFDSITFNPEDGSIEAIQLIALSQPDVAGERQPHLRIARDTIRVTAQEAATILGEAAYIDLMTRINNAMHTIARAQGKEPAP